MADINRLKVVLVEQKKRVNGWLKHWVKTLLQFPSGVRIHPNQASKPFLK